MSNDFHSDAADYLLHHMDAARRAAFEHELHQNPEARAALKEAADSFAAFASQVAPPEPLGAADQRATLDAIIAATQPPEKDANIMRTGGTFTWLHFLWPMAAMLLLTLNLFDFNRPFAPPAFAKRTPSVPGDATASKSDGTVPTVAKSDKSDPSGSSSADPKSSGANSTGTSGLASTPTPDERTREVERLRRNVSDLEREQERIRSEYDALVERVARIGAIEHNMSRLTTMELVDANSYARGERKGLVGVGRNILTEPGVVVIPDPVNPPANGSGIAQPKLPYAWSVFDEREQRGYLNLYNLPTVAPEQTMQIWMRNPETREYQSVGVVPSQFHGGNGSVQFTLPNMPSELLITLEPRNSNATAPTGPTVIRGP